MIAMVRRVDSSATTGTDQGRSRDQQGRADTPPKGQPASRVDVHEDTSVPVRGSTDVGLQATVAREVESAAVDVHAATAAGGRNVSMPSPAELPVHRWERYELLSLIGNGGMGAVYKARDRRLERVVALKFLRVDDPRLVERFQREASMQARLDHPNICRVFEVGEVDHKPYIAMQFVDGKTLAEAAPSLSLFEKVSLIKQVALALHEAHRLGIIHRDIKPSNIMIQRGSEGGNQPLLMDFGIAHESRENAGLTETGAVMGTPSYMSPEQARGGSRTVDRRADVYSLGATLYELLTGMTPFGGTEVVDVLLAVLSEEPKPPRTIASDVPRDLETIVLKCLAKDAGQRYDSARALAEDLQRYIDGEPILGKRASLLLRLRRQYRKHRALFAIGILAAMLSTLLAGIGIRERVRSQRQAELAQRLGSEMKDMEWLLRSARQLPLHDLGHEKAIMRQRMQKLQSQILQYGKEGEGFGHFALGRGHLALQEYPQALVELRAAQKLGVERPELHYALGLVLGKHFDQAMYEARLAGGGDWAQKKRKELVATYLVPALDSLRRSRATETVVSEYLDGVIAYYQQDHAGALRHAQAALVAEPWLYEAWKLQGDVYLEVALKQRDAGQYTEAEGSFAATVKAYEAAARIGQSDSEVYEGLAEAWVRQVEMAMNRGLSTASAYQQAVVAGKKLALADPTSVEAFIKQAVAAYFVLAYGVLTPEIQRACQVHAQAIMSMHTRNPYAQDAAANCLSLVAALQQAQGVDPQPAWFRAIELLESAVTQHPQFVWGRNDLASVRIILGQYQRRIGHPSAHDTLSAGLGGYLSVCSLDPTYRNGPANVLFAVSLLVPESQTEELISLLGRAEDYFARCMVVNSQNAQCFNNYFQIYAQAAQRESLAGRDPARYVAKALPHLQASRRLGGKLLDAEQLAMLLYLVQAREFVNKQQDPAPALAELHVAQKDCLALSKTDAMCLTLGAQAMWVVAQAAGQTGPATVAALEDARIKAQQATESPEKYPDAWQTLAETHVRLAQAKPLPARAPHLAKARAALDRAFAINKHHAAAQATEQRLARLMPTKATP